MSKLSHDEVLKMTKLRKIILATIVLMLLSSVGYGADWHYIGKDANNNEWFYDTQSISREQEDTIKVWTKIVLSDKEKADFIKKFQHEKPPSLNYEPPEFYNAQKEKELLQKNSNNKENINHRIERDEIDCAKNRIKVIAYAWFDRTEDLIYNEKPSEPLFSDIAPDSFMNKLVEILCKKGSE